MNSLTNHRRDVNRKTKGSRLAEVHFLTPPFSSPLAGQGGIKGGYPITGGYTYQVPDHLNIESIGIRVRVPFGRTVRIGFITRLFNELDQSLNHSITQLPNYKNIIAPFDLTPLLSADLMELTRWMADYYLCGWGEAIAAAIPTGLKPRRNVKYRLNQVALNEPLIENESSPAGDLWRGLKQQPLSLMQIQRRFPNGKALFQRFRQNNWIESVEVEVKRSATVFDTLWKWTDEISYEEAIEKLPSNAKRMNRAVELLSQSNGSIIQRELSKIEKGLNPAMKSLMKRGWIASKHVPRDRRSIAQLGLQETASSPPQLSERQTEVVQQIQSAIESDTFTPFLLHGVTGSGKTLVYLEAIASALQAGKNVIVMTPEISLTPQLTGRLYRRFGDKVIVTHSGLSQGERQDAWRLIRSGVGKVVVGPRSTLFAPIEKLGLIIIDEEHDDSYKQSNPAPRYNGRDAAIYRAMKCDAVVLLGSATPSVTSYHNGLTGRWQLLELPERYGDVKLPDVRVIKWGIGGEGTMLSPPLKSRVEQTLENGEQTILLVNRRAFSSFIKCPDCGEVAMCPNCDITLRYHRVGQKLECHYCGYGERVYDLCPHCKGQRLRFSGIGTQRVEREMQRLFPDARIARMDWDTTRRAGSHQEILSQFARKEYDILLGTQMVAKGHDFPGVTLVGILAADFEWILPDFRSIERAFRLLVQASGRTGRDGKGEVVIQSFSPSHPMLRWVQAHDYRALYDSEVTAREMLKYPPFGRLVIVTVRDEHQDSVIAAAEHVKDQLSQVIQTGTILGPATPPVERVEGQYRRKLMIKFPSHVNSAVRKDKTTIRNVVNQAVKLYNRKKVKIVVDVDPVEG